jgi:glycosyltransferase involved in cell wall biosynthesis
VRILHVVTLVSADGAFGGPTRVALNQAAALRARGHRVLVAAGRPAGESAEDLAGDEPDLHLFPARRLVPGTGFSGLVAPGMLRWLDRALDGADVVHVHLARDLVTLPAARLAVHRRVPVVLQPHGMVVETDHRLAGPLDAALTRGVLGGAAAVLNLTPEERAGLIAVGPPGLDPQLVRNGVPLPDRAAPLPDRLEVLYCARLQARKRPLLFVEMAEQLLARGVEADFVLVGPDGGEGDAVRARIAAGPAGDRIRWEGPVAPDAVVDRIASASLVVLPSIDEPYPMSVLEAMSVGRGVVVTDTCGLAPAVAEHECGAVVDASIGSLVDAVAALVRDRGALATTGARAYAAAERHFGMPAVAGRLEEIYRDAKVRSIAAEPSGSSH